MRIAHVTDLHFRHYLPGTAAIPTRLSRRMPELLERAVDAIRDEPPDLLVLSGDLLDFPTDDLADEDLFVAAAEDLDLVREIIEDAECPFAVVHGNHDPQSLLREIFSDCPEDRVIAGHRVISFFDEEVTDNVPERLGAERDRFLAALKDAVSPPQIHVQHYLVWPIRNEGYPHSYRDAEDLHARIADSGRVRLVLSGHYHPGIEPFREGGTYFAAAPAFCEAPHRYWIYELTADKLAFEERLV